MMSRRKWLVALVALVAPVLVAWDLPQAPARPSRGIVYQTDDAAEPGVVIAGTFPENTHPPIIHPIALAAGATNSDAEALLSFIKSAKAKPLFEAQGFTVLASRRS